MTVKIMIPTPLRPSVGNQECLILEYEGTLKDVLTQVAQEYPDVNKYLFDDAGELRGFVNFYVNDEDVRDKQQAETPLSDGDVLSIVPAIAGGW